MALLSVTSRRADAVVLPEEGSVTQCLGPSFPILPGLCAVDAEGDADEDTLNGNAVERGMFLTGGSREGTSAIARASYLFTFTYEGTFTQDVIVQVPRDDLLAPGSFRGAFRETYRTYPTSAVQPAYLGGPLALTIWTDHAGFLHTPLPTMDVAEYNL